MKKITLILSMIFTFSVLSITNLQAQNVKPITEEAISHNNSKSFINANQGLSSSEERKVNVVVEDHKPE